MASDNTIRTYTSVDIEKYHKGLLSPMEMHDLEKAALDDPFLAEALEGYAVANVDIASDIAELKKRLSERTEENKVVPLTVSSRKSYLWWRVAAMIVLVAGAALLIYQFSTNDKVGKNSSQAFNRTVPDSNKTGASGDTNTSGISGDVATGTEEIISGVGAFKDSTRIGNMSNGLTVRADKDNDGVNDSLDKGFLVGEQSKVQYQNDASTAIADKKAKANDDIAAKELMDEELRRKQTEAEKREMALEKAAAPSMKIPADTMGAAYNYNKGARQQRAIASKEEIKVNSFGVTTNDKNRDNYASNFNIFRGQVTDVDNKALPFANITNTMDNVGTYTDVKGNFTLISPDSVLNVQVRSLGFENNNIQLQNQATTNRIVMQEDRNNLAEVVVSNKRVNSESRSRTSTMVLDEPEPEDGWINYDTYLANNLVVPETFKSRQSSGGQVELSFEVNSKGEPINITVVKSLCESCDKEAIRLVKQGPKWKRKSRKGRTSVTISF